MFIQTWNKYLPVIRILLKRSVNGPQTLDMNQSDFQRAAGGKKLKFTFSIALTKGRMQGTDGATPLANSLITALQQDDITYKFLRRNEVTLTMNSSFQLTIVNTTPAPPPELETDAVTAEEAVKPGDASPVAG